MRNALLLLGLGALLIASSPSSRRKPTAPAPAPSCPAEGTRVLLLGDSIAVGLKVPLGELAKGCATPYAGRAFNGAHVTQWDGREPRLGQAVTANRPTHALISLGANDMGRTDPDNVRAGIDRMVQTLRKLGVTPLWIAPPAMPFADTVGVRAMWRAALGDEGAVFDAETLEAGLELERAPDAVHMTPRGYNQLAGAVWAWLSARGAP